MLMLTKAFQKTFYKKPSSNSQRYSSGSKNFEHKERIEGKRMEEKNPAEEKRQSESTKCYNCGKLEDEYWLDHSDQEDEIEEKEETTHLCLMGKIELEAEAETYEEIIEEVCDMTGLDFINQINVMMIRLQKLESKLKRKRGINKDKNQSIQKLSEDIAKKKVLIEALHKNIDTCAKEKTIILKELAETTSQYKLLSRYPDLHVEWTKLSKEDEAKENVKRQNTTKVQLPFRYERLNSSYSSDKSKFLSDDYFESYSSKELETKSIEVYLMMGLIF
ncbi:hypothetical protein L6452_34388 [Arctium lappa]|uniref:Uncharacterized protein n=1 Tax=Arctium lappa TaxID=4217 RepID=A0ACB8YIC2_ARCLA|nr:hypothetical protein L6452_34388 [Arctium lappa]